MRRPGAGCGTGSLTGAFLKLIVPTSTLIVAVPPRVVSVSGYVPFGSEAGTLKVRTLSSLNGADGASTGCPPRVTLQVPARRRYFDREGPVRHGNEIESVVSTERIRDRGSMLRRLKAMPRARTGASEGGLGGPRYSS